MLPAIPNERILAAAAVAVLLALAPGAGLHAKPRKKAAAAALALEKDSAATGYGKLLKGATKAPGLFLTTCAASSSCRPTRAGASPTPTAG